MSSSMLGFQPQSGGGANTEVCLNLWCYVDEPSGYIYLVSGRAYVLTGTKEEKLAALRRLSVDAPGLVETWPVPPVCSVAWRGATIPGVVAPRMLPKTHEDLFGPVLEALRSRPPICPSGANTAGKTLKLTLPNTPLCLTSCVMVHEDERLEVQPFDGLLDGDVELLPANWVLNEDHSGAQAGRKRNGKHHRSLEPGCPHRVAG